MVGGIRHPHRFALKGGWTACRTATTVGAERGAVRTPPDTRSSQFRGNIPATAYRWTPPQHPVLRSEPMTGVEPACPAWEAGVLPLNYIGTCLLNQVHSFGLHVRVEVRCRFVTAYPAVLRHVPDERHVEHRCAARAALCGRGRSHGSVLSVPKVCLASTTCLVSSGALAFPVATVGWLPHALSRLARAHAPRSRAVDRGLATRR